MTQVGLNILIGEESGTYQDSMFDTSQGNEYRELRT